MMNDDWRPMSVEDLGRLLKEGKECGRPATVLLGAGASKSAGIPLARDLAEEATRKYPGETRAQAGKGYAAVMDCLNASQQAKIIEPHVAKARLNAAHAFLADLVRTEYVDLILTTNFDSLASLALTYAGEPHYEYDIANLRHFYVSVLRPPAVLYLHGRFGAFVNVHSPERAAELGPSIKLICDYLVGRTVIVVGYSGEVGDPVFAGLCSVPQFSRGLVWTYHGDAEPKSHVKDGLLLDHRKACYYMRNQPADLLFPRLCAAVGVESLAPWRRPFTFLNSVLERVASVDHQDGSVDIAEEAKKWTQSARSCFEDGMPCLHSDSRSPELSLTRAVARAKWAFLHSDTNALRAILDETGDPATKDRIRRLLEAAYVQRTASYVSTTPAEELDVKQQIIDGIHELSLLSQRQFNALQENVDVCCPNVFTLRPVGRLRWPKSLVGQKVELQLYCQAPGCWHPTSVQYADEGIIERPGLGRYEFKVEPDWIQAVTPYVRSLARVLKHAVPLAGAATAIVNPQFANQIGTEITLAIELTDRLTEPEDSMDARVVKTVGAREEADRLGGAALRAIRKLLDEKDPTQHWGGLRRILTPEGHYLWLCERHAREYEK
jgi:hypothetical protein